MRLRLPVLMILACAIGARAQERLETLKRTTDINAPVGRQADGRIIVPTNQVLDPAGRQVEFPGKPVDLHFMPDGKTVAVMERNGLVLIDIDNGTVTRQVPIKETSFHGITASADGSRIYLSRSEGGIVAVDPAEADNKKAVTTINLKPVHRGGSGPVPGGLALSADEKTLYATFSRNNTLGEINLETGEIREIETGIAPYDVLIAGPYAYVANWAGRRPVAGEKTGPTSGSEMLVNEKTYAAASGTVTVIDLAERKAVGEIEVGLHSSGMVIAKDGLTLYVANANSDTVSVINTMSRTVTKTIGVRPKEGLPFGSAPNALALSKDEKTLYVANGSNNSIALIDLEVGAVKGLIPTGWYPAAVGLDAKGGRLVVANAKGVGSLAMKEGAKGRNSHDHMGSISIIPLPSPEELVKLTARVNENNRLQWSLAGLGSHPRPSAEPVPVPLFEGERSVFKHVIYIIKENRTYDQVFGDIEKGNGEPELCLFGREVTPNQHALAEQFALLDNFYCSGILSADGHHWATGAYATDYLEKSFGGWPRSYPYDGDDMLANSAGGFIWDGVLAKGLTFRNYGEMVKAKIEPKGLGFLDIYKDFISGANTVKLTAMTHLKNIESYICPNYIGFPSTVPDVMRADIFIKELKQFEADGNLPNFIVMLLPNDHTSGTKPGTPTPRACVADNDLAVGRIVEAVSHSRFWPSTVIFITQDDPQAGLDHVDGHRTLALPISPYTKRGFVDSTNYNQTGMLRTMELILGTPAMTQIDLASTPMVNCFQEKANLTPFVAVPNNIPLDEMNPELKALKGDALKWAVASNEEELGEIDSADEDTLNRIVWHSVKGYDVAYPVEKYGRPRSPEEEEAEEREEKLERERDARERNETE